MGIFRCEGQPLIGLAPHLFDVQTVRDALLLQQQRHIAQRPDHADHPERPVATYQSDNWAELWMWVSHAAVHRYLDQAFG